MMRSIQVNALNLAIFSIIFIVFVFLSSPAHCIPLTEEAWNNWEYLSLPEQLVYILDDGELQSLKEEHALLGPATLKDLLVTHREFQDPKVTEDFFRACDSDNSNDLTFQEYCVCRGDYDRFGVMNDISEYATRADYLLEDFEVQIQSQWQREERVKRFKEEEEEEAEIDLDLEADTHTSIRTGMGEVNMETNSAVDAATVESDGAEAVGEERNSQSVGAGSGSAQEKMNAEHERVEL